MIKELIAHISSSLNEAELTDPHKSLLPSKKLTEEELTNAVRQSIIAEQDAVALYESFANLTENEQARSVFQSIADEEKVHVGEFERLLTFIKPNEPAFREDGRKEADDLMKSKEVVNKIKDQDKNDNTKADQAI